MSGYIWNLNFEVQDNEFWGPCVFETLNFWEFEFLEYLVIYILKKFLLCSPTSTSMESKNERNFSSFIQPCIVPSGIPRSRNKLAFDSPFLTPSIIFNFSMTINCFLCPSSLWQYSLLKKRSVHLQCGSFLNLLSPTTQPDFRPSVEQVKGLACELNYSSCLIQMWCSLNFAVWTNNPKFKETRKNTYL
jgi:hypothetical protein